jgi:1,2-diacylglycerol 3-alpha-glucosyltransferase
MRILFVSDTYYPHINGVYYFVRRLGQLLQQNGYEIAVIAPSDSIFQYRKKVDGLDVYYLPSFPAIYYPSVRFTIPFLLRSRIKKIIKSFKPDIIHIQDHLLISKVVVRINRMLKIPIIGTNHLMPENFIFLVPGEKLKQYTENFIWKDFSRVFNQVNVVTTPSETGARLIRSKLKVETVAISNGVSLEQFSSCCDTAHVKEKYLIPDKPVLLYIGRLDREKHIEEILHSVAIAIKKIDFRFVLVGKGMNKNALVQLANKLGISEKVIFTGFVSDEELPYMYKLGRCYIIASIAELQSITTLQAMASGLPVIAVNACALTELVKDKINGYLYNEGDIYTLSKHIEDVIRNDELYRTMSKKSLEIAREHDIYKTLDSFEKLYQVQQPV